MADTIVRKVIMQLTADDTDAAAKLDAIKAKADELRASNPELTARIDTAEASAKMAVFKQELRDAGKDVTAKVNADTTEADAKIDNTNRKLDELNSKKVDPGGGGGIMGMMMWPAIIGAVAAALPALPAALYGVGAAAGTMALAFGPVIKALTDTIAVSQQAGQASAQLAATEQANATAIASAQQAVADATTQSAHDQITSAQQIASAQQSLADAQRTAAQDAVNSAQQVASAERSLATAQQSEQNAQQSLTLARQQAVLTLQTLNDQQVDGQLNAQQAALNLQQAQANEATVNSTATSTALERAQALLSVQEAQQALVEANQNATNTTNAANTANQEGVDGLPAVVQAQQAAAQAVQGVADAQQALQNASTASAQQQQKDAEAVQNATQNLANVQQQASWQQQKDTEAVSNAVGNLNNMIVQQRLAEQATAAASPTAQLSKEMAGLAAPAQQVVGLLVQMGNELKPLENLAQTALMPGVLTFLQGLQSLLPSISGEVTAIGGIMGATFADWGKIMESSGFKKDLEEIFGEANKFLQVVLPAFTGLVNAFMAMGANSGGVVSGFAQGIAAIMGGFGQLFQALAQNAPALGQFWAAVGGIIGALGGPLGTLVGALAGALVPVLNEVLIVLQLLAPPFDQIVKAVGAGLAQALAQLMPQLTPVVAALMQLLTQVVIPLLPSLTQLVIAVAGIAVAILPLVTAGVELLTKVFTPLVPVLAQVTGWSTLMAGAIGQVVGWIAQVIGAGLQWITNVGNIKGAWSDLTGWAKDNIAKPFTDGVDIVVRYFQQLPGAIARTLSGVGSAIWDALTGAFKGVFNWIAEAWNISVGSLHFTIPSWIPGIGGDSFGVPLMPILMAQGGLISETVIGHGLSSGRTYMLGEQGPEWVVPAGRAASAGTGGGQTVTVQLEFVGNANDQFWQLMKRNIRIRGGNVSIVGA